MSPLHKIGWLLLAFAAVPVAVVATAELVALDENERVLREVYERHVDAVLTSLNQHVWTVTSGWADDLGRRLDALPDDASETEVRDALAAFVAAQPSVGAAFVADTTAGAQVLVATPGMALSAADLGLRPPHAARLRSDRAAGYQRLLPIPLREDRPDATVALAFVTGEGTAASIAGFVLDAPAFAEGKLAPKLREAAQEHFVVGIAVDGELRQTVGPSVVGVPTGNGFTADLPPDPERLLQGPDVQERTLWVLPNHTLRIRPAGATIGNIVADRMQRSLLLVGLLALALTGGAVLLFRTVRRQVELAQAKAVFVQNVSHELRTPLALIRMYAETLELGRAPEARQRDYIRTIAQEAGRLTRLVNNILNFSRIESGRKEVASTPFGLNALAEEALRLYRFHLDSAHFTVETDLADPAPVALGDREATTEALVNLIDNAVKYGGDARFLAVATGHDGDAAWIEVRDRGLGISLREQRRIFEEFYRVPTGAVHDAPGTGLGLALVKHLAEAQSGRVSVESELGRGSTFRLTLPAAPAAASVPAPPAVAADAPIPSR